MFISHDKNQLRLTLIKKDRHTFILQEPIFFFNSIARYQVYDTDIILIRYKKKSLQYDR